MNGTQQSNHTLDPDVNSLRFEGLEPDGFYGLIVAAYNRQGVGPFTDEVTLLLAEDGSLALTTTASLDVDLGFDVVTANNNEDLIATEVWFVALVSGVTAFVLVAFFVAVCVNKQRNLISGNDSKDSSASSGGHYNGKHLHFISISPFIQSVIYDSG